MGQLTRVLDRLPPGPAGQGEVAVYLATLIRWLNTDPWPQDARFDGPALTPAVVERKLRIASGGGEQDLDADDLGRRCTRLVILGGPGSGKTWLARRTARLCAETALGALAAGALPDEVELPLYTTCARLSAALPGDGIRRAVVSSALAQLPDLGGSRIVNAMRLLFEERDAPTLLVADSLDEARGADDRICQADTLKPTWRIVLTSRPASWNRQFAIDDGDPSRRVGLLHPLRYPEDVEPFIACWFSGRPACAADLAAQLRDRPVLQQAATVPLILAFYCIIGGGQPLPDRRADLYAKVIRRMLTGRWRGGGDRHPDPDACLKTLRDWAWYGATDDPVSGIGMWADDIATPRARSADADANVVDHVATPVGPPDVDTGKTLRRFIHRSIREHLVAEHVASLPADEVPNVLLPHLWYDSHWKYAAPAAIAMHPQHDQILRQLICYAARSNRLPADLSAIDAGWELRGLLARVASETTEGDWSPEVASLIGKARTHLMQFPEGRDLQEPASWETSNRQVSETLLGLLRDVSGPWDAAQLTGALVRVASTTDQKREARKALLGQLPASADAGVAAELTSGLARLDPTVEEKLQAREALLGYLAHQTRWVRVDKLVDGVVQLAATAEEERQARTALLGLPAETDDSSLAAFLLDGVVQLAPTADDRRQVRDELLTMLAHQADSSMAAHLAKGLASLEPTAEDTRRACKTLLGLLPGQADGRVAARLARALASLDATAADKRKACEALLGLLASQADSAVAADLVGVLASLDLTAEENRQARQALLGLLTSRADSVPVAQLASVLIRLDPTPEDERQAREALLGCLARQNHSWLIPDLISLIVGFAPTAEGKVQVRQALLELLADPTCSAGAVDLLTGLFKLVPTPEEERQARVLLIGLLAGHPMGRRAERLARIIGWFASTAEDRCEAREALLGLLSSQANCRLAGLLAGALVRLHATADEQCQARGALLDLLTGQADSVMAIELAQALVLLGATIEDKRRARIVLLDLLGRRTDGRVAPRLAVQLIRLGATADDKRRVRGALLDLLSGDADSDLAEDLVALITQLDPTVDDLTTWRAWNASPTVRLLAAARRNSTLDAWLAALPSLPSSGHVRAGLTI